MGVASSAAIEVLRTDFSRNFQDAYDTYPQWHMPLMTNVPSTTSMNTYGWMKQIPALREWLGPRVIHQLAESDYTIKNKKYELTLGIPEDDFEDDNLGQYVMQSRLLGESAAQWFDDILLSLMENGATDTCFDGLSFFNTAHLLSGSAQSNLLTGTALTGTNIFNVMTTMGNYKGESGRKLGVAPTHLVVPTALLEAAHTAVKAERLAAGATNVARGLVEVVHAPKLDNATYWYMVDARRAIKPFIKQLRRDLRKVEFTSERDGNVFWDGEFVWGYDGRGNGGYGPWWLCARCNA